MSVVHGRAADVRRAGLIQRAPELDPALIQKLRDRCVEQARQLQSLQAQFNRTSLCLDVFSITTQHFCHKVRMFSLWPRLEDLCVASTAALNQEIIVCYLHLRFCCFDLGSHTTAGWLMSWDSIRYIYICIDVSVVLQCEITAVSGSTITGLQCFFGFVYVSFSAQFRCFQQL